MTHWLLFQRDWHLISTRTLGWIGQRTAVLSMKWKILLRNLMWFIIITIPHTATGGSVCAWFLSCWGSRGPSERDWELYLSSFSEMLLWFSAFHHVNYTRWAIVFLADMKLLRAHLQRCTRGLSSMVNCDKKCIQPDRRRPSSWARQ